MSEPTKKQVQDAIDVATHHLHCRGTCGAPRRPGSGGATCAGMLRGDELHAATQAVWDLLHLAAPEEADPAPEPRLMKANGGAEPWTAHAYNHGDSLECRLLGCVPVDPAPEEADPHGT